jgi:hypothetical protein
VLQFLARINGLGRGLAALLILGGVLVPGTSSADVGRIREMAIELEQKLAKHRFEVAAKAEKSATARIYKDFDFILKKNKVDEVSAEVGTDPDAERLRMYLIEAIVNAEIASFVDDLVDFEQNGTVPRDDVELRYADILRLLAVTKDDGERRKVASLLPPLLETSAVFRREIGKRRNDLYQPWGYANYAEFYAQREDIDLALIGDLADSFLKESQALYDSLFTLAAERYMNTEARKVRFGSLPYLTQGTEFEGAFPSAERMRRTRGLFSGLGIDISESPGVDRVARPGKALRPDVFPIIVPEEVEVSIYPMGAGVRDGNRAVYALGEALIFTLSTKTGLERGHLVNHPAQAAMAWIPRFVLDEPGWIGVNVNSEGFGESDYLFFRAFLALYEARFMAAQVKFEKMVYAGVEDANAEFRALMRETTGARLSTNDATRSLEFLTQLKVTSQFYGLLVASEIRKQLREKHGEDWYSGGKSGGDLLPLWNQGGSLTIETIIGAFPQEVGSAAFLANIHGLLAGN